MDIGEKAATAIVWSAVEKWGARLINLCVLILLGRMLAPSEFGLIALGMTVVTLSTIFVDAGFGKALIQRERITELHRSTAFWASISIGLLLAATLIGFSNHIAAAFGEPRLRYVVMVLSISVVINSASTTHAALLERDLNFRGLALRRLIAAAVGGILAVMVALNDGGVWSLVAQSIGAALAGAICLWLIDDWYPRFRISLRALRDLWSTGASIVAIELVGYINSQSDRLLIGYFLSVDTLGYYFLAMSFISIMSELFASVFANVSLSVFSRLQSSRADVIRWFYRFTNASAAIALPVFGLAAISAPAVIPAVVGPEWTAAVPIFQLLTALGAANSVLYFDRSVLIGIGRPGIALWVSVGQTAFGLMLLAAGVSYGVFGVVLAVILRQYLYWPIRILVLRKTVGIRFVPYLRNWIPPFVISLIPGLVCFLAVEPRIDPIEAPAAYLAATIPAAALWIAGNYRAFMKSFVADLGGQIDSAKNRRRTRATL